MLLQGHSLRSERLGEEIWLAVYSIIFRSRYLFMLFWIFFFFFGENREDEIDAIEYASVEKALSF